MSRVRLFGIHPVSSALRNQPESVNLIRIAREARNRRLDELSKLAREAGVAVHSVARTELDQQASDVRHQDVMAEIEPDNLLTEADLPDKLETLGPEALLLILDQTALPRWFVMIMGALLVIGRLMHAWGFGRNAGYSIGRFYGSLLTWGMMLITALVILYVVIMTAFT